jgi:hypothetical protein
MSSLPIPSEGYEVDVITSDINEPNFYALLPNMVEELLTDAYERSLYWHYRKITGDVGTCFEGAAKTAEKSGMGITKFREVRQSLNDKGLIRLTKRKNEKTQQWDSYHVRIVPVWHLNNFYVWSNNPKKYSESLEGISPDEVGVLRRAIQGISPDAHNKESVKKNAVKKSAPADAGTSSRGKAKRSTPIPWPVPGVTEKFVAGETTKNTTAPKERERDLLFESVLLHGHGITYTAGMKVPERTAGWVRGVVKELKFGGVDPQRFVKFCESYPAWSGGLSFPRDAVKLLASYNQWNSEQTTKNEQHAVGELTPLQKRFVQQFGVSPAVAAQTEVEVILSQLQSVGDSPEFLQGLVG